MITWLYYRRVLLCAAAAVISCSASRYWDDNGQYEVVSSGYCKLMYIVSVRLRSTEFNHFANRLQ